VLKNLSLVVEAGEKVGIVGRTGAGKTSFIKLFWKCLDSQEGQLLIDGKDIENLDLKAMRREIMVISQETALFAGTLRENIEPTLEYMFGEKDVKSKKAKKAKKPTPNELAMKKLVEDKEKWIMEVLRELGFGMDKIEKQGLDFEIEAGGENLSQGEKQIVCFVRALAEKKKVIILDEATAAIDLKTEQAI
jgi:ATP-binding cassette subfamily C (CFTR/MRP) protein 1